jgi:type II secretory ATPase GspE/PulE/Tfp pilus assembly ATPase PilB-like protein
MENAIDLPAPPHCAPKQENDVKAGESVIVSLQDGNSVSAKLVSFDADNAVIIALLKGKDKPVKIPMPMVQIMHLPTPRQWSGEGESAPQLQPFQVTFKDGSSLDGETISFRQDKNGVHVFPKFSMNKFQHSFIPFQSIKECRVGDTEISPGAARESTMNQAASDAGEPKRARIDDVSEFLQTTAIKNSEELEAALTRQKSMPNMKLGEILVSENLVTEEQIQEALEEQKKRKGTPLGEILVSKGIVTTSEIQQSLARKLGIPFLNLKEYQIGPDALKMVPQDIAEQHVVIPVHVYDDKLAVALENPMNWDALDALRFHTNVYIEPVMATEEDIIQAISFYYSPTDAIDESIDEITEADGELEALNYDEDLNSDDEDISDNVVVKLLNKIIVDAQARNISDIHVEPSPGKGKIQVRFRKDGSLVNYHELPAQYKNALISRIKILAKLDISEKRRPQDGKIEFKKSNGEKLELRVAILPTVNGQEDVVMRILAGGKPIPLEKLGLSERNHTELKKAVSKPYGLFLVCGPTGSGKTTTLHSVLGHINQPETKIWTAEDPVEITQKGLRQVQVNSKIGLDFAAAMRAFLRADPDVIMVGEMRDHETVHIGVEASLTGHLVFSTLHTNSAPESVVRLLDMGMDPFNFADALLGILAQRLAKRLCGECKEAYTPDDNEINDLVMEYSQEFTREMENEDEKQAVYDRIKQEWTEKFTDENGQFQLYKRTGCGKCESTGYAGRIGLHELLIGSDDVKRDILTQSPVSKILDTCLKEGMRTLRQDGIEKVIQGHTDIMAIRAVCAK